MHKAKSRCETFNIIFFSSIHSFYTFKTRQWVSTIFALTSCHLYAHKRLGAHLGTLPKKQQQWLNLGESLNLNWETTKAFLLLIMMKLLPISKPWQFSLVHSRKSDCYKKRFQFCRHKRAFSLKFHYETCKNFAGIVWTKVAQRYLNA